MTEMEVDMDIENGGEETEEVITRASLNFTPEGPPSSTSDEESKTHCILEGTSQPFPGNGSTVEYFQAFLSESSCYDKIALIDEECQSSFYDFAKQFKKFALAIKAIAREHGLVNHNPNQDWVIAVCLPPSAKLITTLFAIHKLGAAYLPIDPSFPENRIVSIVTSARPILVISDNHPSTLLKFETLADKTKIITLECLIERATETESKKVIPFRSKVPTLAERVAIVLYTSGSSGTPKGVRLTHRTIMNRLSWQWETFPYEEGEKCCFKTALTFVDSVSEIFGPLLRGHSVTIFSRLVVANPHLLIKKMNKTQITRIVIVPSLLRTLLTTLHVLTLEANAEGSKKFQRILDLSSVKLWVVSGETLHRELVDDFFKTFPNATLCNFYGSTEIMGDVTYEKFTSIEDVEKQCDGIHVPIGIPVFNTILYILDEQLKIVNEGEIGELYVAGYNVSSGYVGIVNSDKFLENPYTNTLGFNTLFRTGDFARIGKKYGRKTIFYEGRSDSQIKVRGHRVDLNEIESVINTHTELIKTSVVLCHNPGKDDQTIVAFILTTGKEVTSDDILRRLRTTLKPYEMPEIKLITEIPLLVNGKVDRQRFLNMFETHRNKVTGAICDDNWDLSSVAPEHLEQARALLNVISEVTRVPPTEIIGNLDESFFTLGGNSLNAICVVSLLRQRRFQISLDDFVTSKSIREMITKVSATGTGGAETPATDGKASRYFAEFLNECDEIEATSIIAHSFSRKGDLEVYTNATFNDFKDLMEQLFPEILNKGLSFAVRRKIDQKIVGIALNFDIYDEPEGVTAAPPVQTVLDFLESVESKQREKLPKGRKKILHSFMMGTHELVTEAENVVIVTFMEQEIERMARGKNYIGVMTTNTNPLTRQICGELLQYETLVDVQVNKYEAPNGSKPFRLAPGSLIVTCCWKKLKDDCL